MYILNYKTVSNMKNERSIFSQKNVAQQSELNRNQMSALGNLVHSGEHASLSKFYRALNWVLFITGAVIVSGVIALGIIISL